MSTAAIRVGWFIRQLVSATLSLELSQRYIIYRIFEVYSILMVPDNHFPTLCDFEKSAKNMQAFYLQYPHDGGTPSFIEGSIHTFIVFHMENVDLCIIQYGWLYHMLVEILFTQSSCKLFLKQLCCKKQTYSIQC